MRAWTHDELHALMDDDPVLKEKSDRVHALSTITSEEEEQGKLRMMEIYSEAVGCGQVDSAKEFVVEVFKRLRQQSDWADLRDEYTAQ